MIETTPSLQQVALQARLAQAAICLTHREAQAAVKREIQRQGRGKLSQIAHREIVAMANEYLAEHRVELIAGAKAIVEEWRREGFFGKRAARELERNSQVTSKEGRTATQGLLLNESHAQNGAVK